MEEWLEEWGPRPKRVVRPYWSPPSLIIRQAISALLVGTLTRWRSLPYWVLRYGFKCLPGAAGSKGMGCIGFPSHPVWEVTTRCNLRCIHCHTLGGVAYKDELSTSEGKNLLRQLSKISEFRMMAFTGGEPLVRKDIFELLAYSKALGFTNTIATNATLIDDTVAQRLREHGVVIAAVSLDGADAQTHDHIRGKEGIFKNTIRGIQALNRAGILIHINITAMGYNVLQLAPLIDLVNKVNAGLLLVYQLVPVGRGNSIKDAVLNLGANEKLIKFLVQVQPKTRAIIEPVAGPQYWPYLLQRARIKGGLSLKIAEKVFHGCSAGRGFVYIKPDGEVWPCPFIESSCGNIREKSFREIWEQAPLFKHLRSREHLLKGKCGECQYRKLCGGCRGRSLVIQNDHLAEDPTCFIHNK